MLFFVDKGYRVIAHDRRGHGRSSQVSNGHDMEHYAADAAAVMAYLDFRNTVHIGRPTGGGEVAAYVARHGKGRGLVTGTGAAGLVVLVSAFMGMSFLGWMRVARTVRPWALTAAWTRATRQ